MRLPEPDEVAAMMAEVDAEFADKPQTGMTPEQAVEATLLRETVRDPAAATRERHD